MIIVLNNEKGDSRIALTENCYIANDWIFEIKYD